jgi:para-nitrobenzyl esterase
MFTVPAHRLARAVQASGPTAVMYRFGWPTPVAGLGACHNLDVPFVFGTLAAATDLVGTDPPVGLAQAMHAAWVAFATDGQVPGWPAYEPDHPREVVLDSATTVAAGPGPILGLWAVLA